MPELSTLIANNYYPRFKKIHDCVDTGTPLILDADSPILFPCDCVTRNYKSTEDTIFSGGTIKDSIENATIFCKFNGILNGPINTIMQIIIYIPHPTLGDIPVETMDYTIKKNNTDVPFSLKTELYNSTDGEAHTYGFNVMIEVNAQTTLKARSFYGST